MKDQTDFFVESVRRREERRAREEQEERIIIGETSHDVVADVLRRYARS